MDLQGVIVGSDVLVVRQGLSSGHSGSDLELSAIWEWLSLIAASLLVDEPSLLEVVVAVLVINITCVVVALSIQALVSVVSDVPSGTGVPLDFVGVVTNVLSHGGILTWSETISLSWGDALGSLVEGSDGVRSGIEGPPLVFVVWVVVLNSQVFLSRAHVLTDVDGSVLLHSGSDLESDS